MESTSAQPPVDVALNKGDDPLINLPKSRLVTMHLVASEAEAPCSFWVGLAPEGDQAPSKLMDFTSIGSLLTEAATRGVRDGGPLMLSDTSVVPPRYVYLLPVPKGQLVDRAQWIHDLVSTVRSWSPQGAGFYIAPELVESAEAIDLLLAVLAESISNAPTREYYLLTGTYGLNSLLNAALRLKSELDSETLSLHVFH